MGDAGLERGASAPTASPSKGGGGLAAILDRVNGLMVLMGSVALVLAALVLTYSVASRYFLKWPTEWQDEASVYLIVGAVFLSCAWVQSGRGHVAIEALPELLPRRIEKVRLLIADLIGFGFCSFFAWKSWTLMLEAIAEDRHTNSTWGPPLSIPYGVMALGMTLFSIQILSQIATAVPRTARILAVLALGLAGAAAAMAGLDLLLDARPTIANPLPYVPAKAAGGVLIAVGLIMLGLMAPLARRSRPEARS